MALAALLPTLGIGEVKREHGRRGSGSKDGRGRRRLGGVAIGGCSFGGSGGGLSSSGRLRGGRYLTEEGGVAIGELLRRERLGVPRGALHVLIEPYPTHIERISEPNLLAIEARHHEPPEERTHALVPRLPFDSYRARRMRAAATTVAAAIAAAVAATAAAAILPLAAVQEPHTEWRREPSARHLRPATAGSGGCRTRRVDHHRAASGGHPSPHALAAWRVLCPRPPRHHQQPSSGGRCRHPLPGRRRGRRARP
eukprot:7330156-Prymnesium_polylepis.2